MTKANGYPIPTTPLEKEVARIALQNARTLVAQGQSAEDAARIACHGSWAEWYGWVVARLRESEGG